MKKNEKILVAPLFGMPQANKPLAFSVQIVDAAGRNLANLTAGTIGCEVTAGNWTTFELHRDPEGQSVTWTSESKVLGQPSASTVDCQLAFGQGDPPKETLWAFFKMTVD